MTATSIATRPETRPDAALAFRTVFEGLVALLPRTCRSGRHDLLHVGYRATEYADLVRVSCQACRAEPFPEEPWILHTGHNDPIRAELDDAPYRGLGRGRR